MYKAYVDAATCSGWSYWCCGTLLYCGASTEVLTFNPLNEIVLEYPQWYKFDTDKGTLNPNDLMKVAYMVGKWEQANARAKVRHVYPRDWKRQVPKKIHNTRVLAALHPEELKIVEPALTSASKKAKTDIIDAVGLALWDQGRKI